VNQPILSGHFVTLVFEDVFREYFAAKLYIKLLELGISLTTCFEKLYLCVSYLIAR